jgi:hypothetical protein
MTPTTERPTPHGAPERLGRRRLLRGVAGGLALGGLSGTAGCLGDVSAYSGVRQWDELSLGEQLEAVRRATGPYADVRAAEADGYRAIQAPEDCASVFYDREGWGADTDLDPLRPASLLYAVEGESLELAAVEYRLPLDDDRRPRTPPDLFNDEGENADRNAGRGEVDGETRREDAAVGGDGVDVATSEASGWVTLYAAAESHTGLFWALTVWVHRPNPRGVFVGTNPTITAGNERACGYGLVGL